MLNRTKTKQHISKSENVKQITTHTLTEHERLKHDCKVTIPYEKQNERCNCTPKAEKIHQTMKSKIVYHQNLRIH